MTDAEIDQIMDELEARRIMNNHRFCEWMCETLKCPRCSPFARRMIGRIVANDEEITELDKDLCG